MNHASREAGFVAFGSAKAATFAKRKARRTSPGSGQPLNRLAVLVAGLLFGSLSAPGSATAASPEWRLCLASSMLAQRSKLDEEEEPPAKPAPAKPKPAKPEAKEEAKESETPPIRPSPAAPAAKGAPPELKPGTPPAIEGEEEEPPLSKKPSPKRKTPKTPPAKAGKSAGPAKDKPAVEDADEKPGAKPSKPASPGKSASKLDGRPEEGAEEAEKPKEDVCDLLFRQPEGGGGGWVKIRLLAEAVGMLRGDQRHVFLLYPKGKQSLLGSEIGGVRYYEDRMLARAAEMVGLAADELKKPDTPVTVADERTSRAAREAEELLRTAVAEHDSAVQRGLRQSLELTENLRRPLIFARANLRVGLIDRSLKQNDLTAALAECDRLTAELGRDEPALVQVRRRVQKIYGIRAREAAGAKDYARVRELLDELSGRSPDPNDLGPEAAAVQNELIRLAKGFFDEGQGLRASSPREAAAKFDEAASIWPRLRGLDRSQQLLREEYQVLHCAYPELPRTLCPFRCRTPVERHGAALVCEGLVRWVDDAAGSHYEPQLADGRPYPLPRGRGFELPRCFWPPEALPSASGSDGGEGKPPLVYACSSEDVRRTVRLLRDPDLLGHSPLHSDLRVAVQEGEQHDRFSVRVTLKEDYWQPLALMDFPILPDHYFEGTSQQDLDRRLDEFGRNPIGTGPYRLSLDERDHPTQRRFVANPYYRKPGLPRIREIVFERFEPTKAVEAFLQGKLDLIYGLQQEHARQLVQQGRRVVPLRTPTVWFLAPNHGRPAMKNENLRLAVLHAINRDEILAQHFNAAIRRGEPDRKHDHEALTGPYPRNSWAYNPNVKTEQLDPQRAKAFAAQARDELRRPLAIELLYPAGQADVEKACTSIERHLKEAGIAVSLAKEEPEKFYTRVLEGRDFDLAYWSYCYPDATYWIGPLVEPGPTGRGWRGWNVLSYSPDNDLAALLHEVRQHKAFEAIRKHTHAIHEHMFRRAILVPLWQLDTYVAIGDRLENVTLDPLVLFGGVERWNLKSSR